MAKTTPAILGMETEITTFTIDMETGEIGAALTQKVSITHILKEINERKDLSDTKKDELKNKIEELEKDSTNPVDNKNKWLI